MGLFSLGRGIAKVGGIALRGGPMVLAISTAPVDGTSGSYAGIAQPGTLLMRSNGQMYVNAGTKASPVWVGFGGAAIEVDGLGVLGVARATFDMAVVANRTIAPHLLGSVIPDNAIIVGGVMQVNTAFTSDATDAGTIAISVNGANDIVSAAAVSGAPYSTTGLKAIIPKANTPESTGIALTAARQITATVAIEPMLTGKLTVNLYYLMGA